MRRHAIILRLGPKDTAPVEVGADVQVTTEIPFLNNNIPASGRVTHERLYTELSRLGLVAPERALDVIVLAVAVFAADTRISRSSDSQDGWTREIDVHVPVSDPTAWAKLTELLMETLRFLTGDIWRFRFRPRPKALATIAPKRDRDPSYKTDTACLFSGGLDSFVGALDLLEAGNRPVLVGHHKSPDVNTPQKGCYQCIEKAYPSGTPAFLNAYLSVPKELFSGSEEKTERGRSFLFLSLGVLVASSLGKKSRLVVPENGVISLNVPLTPLRLGALSTRTTHPYFVQHFQRIVRNLGLDVQLENPYQFKTKGEMVSECKDQTILRKCIGQTMSCAHPTARRYMGESAKHCGTCMPCLIRRAAIRAALGKDPTDYAVDVTTEIPAPDSAAGEDVRAFQIALTRLKKNPALAELLIHKSGPITGDADQWNDFAGVYRRGMQEVSKLLPTGSPLKS